MRLFFIIIILINLYSCKRLIYKDYRDKDYYKLTGGNVKYYTPPIDSHKIVNKMHYGIDTIVNVEYYNSIKDLSLKKGLGVIIQFNQKVFSRDWYSSYPHDGSIEKIIEANFYISDGKKKFNINQFNDTLSFFNKIQYTNPLPVYNSGFEITGDIRYEHSRNIHIKDINDFIDKFNNNQKKFDIIYVVFVFQFNKRFIEKIDFIPISVFIELKLKAPNRKKIRTLLISDTAPFRGYTKCNK